MKTTFFNRFPCLPIATIVLVCGVCLGADQAPPRERQAAVPEAPAKFDLDFLGGPPEKLVIAIEKATGQPLNAVIPDEDKDVTLPALKMRKVTVDDLFSALETASTRTKAQVTGTYFSGGASDRRRSQYQFVQTSFGFLKQGNVWVFRQQKPAAPPEETMKRARFYQPFSFNSRTVQRN